MGKALLPLLLFLFQVCYGQSPQSFVKLRNPNLRYLEHLVKIKLDSVRDKNDLKPFANDSLLYVVSSSHAQYCATNDKSTNHEIEEGKETPEDRVESAGGKNYLLYELLGDVFIHRPVQEVGHKAKAGRTVVLKTYGAVADYIIYKWVNDERVLREILDHRYVTIGSSAQLNHVNDHMMIVCMLGKPYLKYSFTEYKNFFPYSKFQMYELPKSFKDAKSVPNVEYPQKLKVATNPSQYAEWKEDFDDMKFKVVEENGNVYLESESLDQIKRVFEEHKNGLLLELVDYETYHCDNPEYYMRPSKRNGKSVFSGEILTPRFGELILNGVNEKRKVWRLFMGQIPHVSGYYEWNLWLIANKKIAIKKHFDTYCGDALALFTNLPLMSDYRDEHYEYHFHFDTLRTTLKLFEGEFDWNATLTKKLKSMLDKKTEAYENSKVELYFSNPAIPLKEGMHEKYEKAKNVLADTISKSIYADIKVTSDNFVDWNKLDRVIKEQKDSVIEVSSREEQSELLKKAEFAKKYYKELWDDLYVNIEVVHYHDTLKELFKEYHDHLDYLATYEITDTNLVIETEKLQNTLFDYADEVNADPHQFIKMSHIVHKPELARIMNNQAWYEYTHVFQHDHDEEVLKEFYDKINYIANEIDDPKPIYIYNHFAFSVNHWGIHTYDKNFKSKNIKNEFRKLNEKKGVGNPKLMEEALDIKAAHYYHQFGTNKKAIALMEEMVDGIDRLYSTSSSYDTLAKLASTMVYYGRSDRALEILQPIINSGYDEKEALKLYLKLSFEHTPPDLDDINYAKYLKLMAAEDVLGTTEWCELFVGPCNISFQALEYEPLRKKYCEKCGKRGNYATEY